jgi:single-strand DNA-binding protein
MSVIASIHGRIARDPEAKQTKAGKPMTICTIAVDCGKDPDSDETLWVSVLAFGHAADTLLLAKKGESLTAMGRMTRGRYTAKDGTERESWSLLADAVIVARSSRPNQRTQAPRPGPRETVHDFDDEIAF